MQLGDIRRIINVQKLRRRPWKEMLHHLVVILFWLETCSWFIYLSSLLLRWGRSIQRHRLLHVCCPVLYDRLLRCTWLHQPRVSRLSKLLLIHRVVRDEASFELAEALISYHLGESKFIWWWLIILWIERARYCEKRIGNAFYINWSLILSCEALFCQQLLEIHIQPS